MKWNCCNIILLVLGILGVVLVIMGPIILFVIVPPIIEDQITEKVQLLEDTEQFERWVKTPMPLIFKIYVFNVLNPDAIITGAKPAVEEVGPYVYKQFREKKNVKYNEDDDTLEYMQNLKFEFDAEASSPRTEDDEVTVLNVALQGVWQIGEKSNMTGVLNSGWGRMFHDNTTLFHKIKVKDLFFDGYRFCDPSKLEGFTNLLPRTACDNVRRLVESDTMVIAEDNTIVFSFFKHKITKDDGPYVIKAGNLDVNQVGAIETWKGLDFITSWEGGEGKCNNVRGRDSTIYPPFNNDTSSFDVYNTDICRIVNLQTKYKSSYEDIDGWVAELGIDALSNSADEACYCTNFTKNLNGENDCFPDGFGDMGTCLHAPVVISFPHFLGVKDENYIATVDGLTPDDDYHTTFVMIEPGTGTPLKGAKRMQFNMVIRKIDKIVITNELQPAMMPILWVEEGVELPPDLVDQLNDEYLNKLVVVDAVSYTLLGVGVFILIVGFGGLIFRRNK